MSTREDREIIAFIKEGKLDYFEYIVKKYTTRVYSFISKKLYDTSEAEDLVQNTFIKFYKSIHRFDESRPLLPYLFEIAKNEVRMYFRSKKITISLEDVGEIPEEEAVQLLQDAGVEKLLDSLSHEQRKTLLLLASGYTYEEIAQKLKKPVNTIRTIIRRGRLKLIELRQS